MSPLDELLVSGGELDQELVSTVLKPVLRIDKDSLGIRPQDAWRRLSARARIGAYLLARKAMAALGLLEDERCRPAEVIRNTGLPSGTVYPTLKDMFESRPQLVDKSADSRYSVPGWAVRELADLISQEVSRHE
jgi:hypothetical protein